MSLIFTVISPTDIEQWLYGITAIVYIVSLLGVVLKKKWGSILIMIFAIIDVFFAFIVGGTFGLGAGVVDLILIFLGYSEYKQLTK
jgi:uncharacterized membrane protein YjdF